MLPITPVSGLSLFIHLFIILFAKVLGLFGIGNGQSQKPAVKTYTSEPEFDEEPGMLLAVSKSVISVFILISMFTASIGFVTIAIQTGLREGAREPQRSFIEKTFFYERAATAPTFASAPEVSSNVIN